MGSITRSFANNITTSGVLLPASLTNNSISNVTAYNAAIATGSMVLLSTQTASNSATVSFTTGIDSTYKEYQFWFVNVYPRTDNVDFSFNLSTDSGSNYNVTKTTTYFSANHNESGSNAFLEYDTAFDLAQSTSDQKITVNIGNDADQNLSGCLSIFNPSSTTYVKHFLVNTSSVAYHDYNRNVFVAGYGNTTSAINAIRFQMSSGNFDGNILLFGIK